MMTRKALATACNDAILTQAQRPLPANVYPENVVALRKIDPAPRARPEVPLWKALKAYTAAHRAFHSRACKTRTLFEFGPPGMDIDGYAALEQAYEDLVRRRPKVEWLVGRSWGMRIVLWIS
jgi:hypothetical protein